MLGPQRWNLNNRKKQKLMDFEDPLKTMTVSPNPSLQLAAWAREVTPDSLVSLAHAPSEL